MYIMLYNVYHKRILKGRGKGAKKNKELKSVFIYNDFILTFIPLHTLSYLNLLEFTRRVIDLFLAALLPK